MRIKDVELLVGISRKNIRFYEKEGLLSPGRTAENRYRDYSTEDVRRLKEIKLLRKLDVPISEIRSIVERRVSLMTVIKRHIVSLNGRIENITQARNVCQEITEEPTGIAAMDVDAYLEKMDRMDREGVIFVNIKNRDKKNRYVEPIIACIVFVLVMAALAALFVYSAEIDPIPKLFLGILIALPALGAIGTIVALISRLKEIKGGEENDLSKY